MGDSSKKKKKNVPTKEGKIQLRSSIHFLPVLHSIRAPGLLGGAAYIQDGCFSLILMPPMTHRPTFHETPSQTHPEVFFPLG